MGDTPTLPPVGGIPCKVWLWKADIAMNYHGVTWKVLVAETTYTEVRLEASDCVYKATIEP